MILYRCCQQVVVEWVQSLVCYGLLTQLLTELLSVLECLFLKHQLLQYKLTTGLTKHPIKMLLLFFFTALD